jgi:class 3 adenylate cyclase
MTLEEWARSQHLNLTLLFTDIVNSTAIGIKLGDRTWVNDLFDHFYQARLFASAYDCYVVKVIGDALMMAFRTSTDAVNFAMDFAGNTGIDYIGIRVGINSGQVQIRENDIYGLNVNFTARVQQTLDNEGILVSNSVKRDCEKNWGTASGIVVRERPVDLRSFGKEVLWMAFTQSWRKAVVEQRRARQLLLIAP